MDALELLRIISGGENETVEVKRILCVSFALSYSIPIISFD